MTVILGFFYLLITSLINIFFGGILASLINITIGLVIAIALSGKIGIMGSVGIWIAFGASATISFSIANYYQEMAFSDNFYISPVCNFELTSFTCETSQTTKISYSLKSNADNNYINIPKMPIFDTLPAPYVDKSNIVHVDYDYGKILSDGKHVISLVCGNNTRPDTGKIIFTIKNGACNFTSPKK